MPEAAVGRRAARIGGQEPEQDVDAEDDRAGAAQEELRAVPHVADDDAQQRPFVGRQFHDEHGRLALEQGLLEQPRHEQRHDDAEQVHRQHRQARQLEEAEHA